jgi:hypothetical protein
MLCTACERCQQPIQRMTVFDRRWGFDLAYDAGAGIEDALRCLQPPESCSNWVDLLRGWARRRCNGISRAPQHAEASQTRLRM